MAIYSRNIPIILLLRNQVLSVPPYIRNPKANICIKVLYFARVVTFSERDRDDKFSLNPDTTNSLIKIITIGYKRKSINDLSLTKIIQDTTKMRALSAIGSNILPKLEPILYLRAR